MPKKDDDTKNLKLEEYQKIWSKFCFLDESGSLHDGATPFFTVGIIKCSQPHYLNSKIIYERNKRGFYDELHFNKMSRRNIDFAKFAIEAFLDAKSSYFYSYSLDKDGEYFKNHFDSDPWKAYEQISIRLLESVLSPSEILIVIADHVTTPRNIHFEVDVKKEVNNKFKRLAIAGICRFDSRGNDLLQIVDLFIGAINYDLKMETGVIKKGDKNKKKFVKFIKENLGVKSFIGGFRSRAFNIFVDKDMNQRLPM